MQKIHSKAEGMWGLASWKPQLDRPVDRLTPNGMSEGLSGLVLQSFPNSPVPSTHFPVLLFLAWLFIFFLLQDPCFRTRGKRQGTRPHSTGTVLGWESGLQGCGWAAVPISSWVVLHLHQCLSLGLGELLQAVVQLCFFP